MKNDTHQIPKVIDKPTIIIAGLKASMTLSNDKSRELWQSFANYRSNIENKETREVTAFKYINITF